MCEDRQLSLACSLPCKLIFGRSGSRDPYNNTWTVHPSHQLSSACEHVRSLWSRTGYQATKIQIWDHSTGKHSTSTCYCSRAHQPSSTHHQCSDAYGNCRVTRDIFRLVSCFAGRQDASPKEKIGLPFPSSCGRTVAINIGNFHSFTLIYLACHGLKLRTFWTHQMTFDRSKLSLLRLDRYASSGYLWTVESPQNNLCKQSTLAKSQF